jgi:hypothetical protein
LRLSILILNSILFCGVLQANEYNNEWENLNQGNEYYNNTNLENTNSQVRKSKSQAQQKDLLQLQEASSKRIRRFHEVLDDLLAEFGYDVRMGQMNGLKNVSVRKVTVSDALPQSYERYVETLVTERIRDNARVRIISCMACKTKTSRLIEGKLFITSPATNVTTMRDAATTLGIEYFIDVALIYHTTHMVLAFEVFNTQSNELVWARSYNSETIKSRFQKLAIDYKQVEKAHMSDEYVPEYRTMVGFGGGFVPNLNGMDDSSVLGLMVRGTERFDNRRHEFGLQLNLYMSKASFIGGTPAEDESSTKLDPWANAFNLSALYARHFVGSVESYDTIRHGFNGGIGFMYASPTYLSLTARSGWDIFMGKRFVASMSLLYVANAKIYVDEEYKDTKGGIGAELYFSVNF